MRTLEQLLRKRLIICVGSGGVGRPPPPRHWRWPQLCTPDAPLSSPSTPLDD